MKDEKIKCIWMQAGVVPDKYCDLEYECNICSYDKDMNKAAQENEETRRKGKTPEGNRANVVSWKERLKERPVWKRPCVHHMMNRIEFRACNNEYRCGSCEFDQFFQDQYAVNAAVQPVEAYNIEGFRMPQGYYFHQGHTWLKLEEGSLVRVGVDEFALRLFGPFDRIVAPLMGKEVKKGQPEIFALRGDLRAEFISPVTGIVNAVNPELRENGPNANKAPYSDGWVMSVISEDLRNDIDDLMLNGQTKNFMETEVKKLFSVIEEAAGPLSIDGGQLRDDIYGNMPSLDWNKLTRMFLLD
ncbi:glycine cleavage system protein H [Thermodesulfobacteriota bacterium]